MIYIKNALDKRRAKLDGTYPIVIRVSFKGQSRSISTGLTCKAKDWNQQKNSVYLRSDELNLVSNRLQELHLHYRLRALEFQNQINSSSSNVQNVKDFLIAKVSTTSNVHNFWISEIERMIESKRYGNARNYKSAFGGINRVVSLKIPFSRIDVRWLLEVETILLNQNVSKNGVSVYMRTLRAIYNSAISTGLASDQDYPFKRYKIKTQATSPKVLSLEELTAFFNFSIDPSDTKYKYWNYGRLMFLLRGINFTDLALLRASNLNGRRLIYRRAKTHKNYEVELTKCIMSIFSLYKGKEFLLPILNADDLNDEKKLPERIAQKRKTTNKWLTQIGKELELSQPLTSYVFRYSWANAAKSLGFSKDLIAEALGHQYGNPVTGIYLSGYRQEKIDQMNQVICDSVT